MLDKHELGKALYNLYMAMEKDVAGNYYISANSNEGVVEKARSIIETYNEEIGYDNG